jgi:hypothetical protein
MDAKRLLSFFRDYALFVLPSFNQLNGAEPVFGFLPLVFRIDG